MNTVTWKTQNSHRLLPSIYDWSGFQRNTNECRIGKKWIQALKKLPPLQQQYTAQTCRANKKGNILNLCSWKPNKFAKTCNTTTAILVRLLGNRFPCTYVCMGFMFVLYFRRILGVYECVCATTWRVTSVFMVSMVFLIIQTQYRKSNITNIRTCDVRTPWCYN